MTTKRPNWTVIRAALWQRCDGLCEVSGQPLDPDTFDVHHRRQKGMGGTSRTDRDALTNLLALAPLVHNLHPQSVHMRPQWSRDRGYLVPKHENAPHLVPVYLQGRRWVLLSSGGPYIPI